jgi:hypothetical protein
MRHREGATLVGAILLAGGVEGLEEGLLLLLVILRPSAPQANPKRACKARSPPLRELPIDRKIREKIARPELPGQRCDPDINYLLLGFT